MDNYNNYTPEINYGDEIPVLTGTGSDAGKPRREARKVREGRAGGATRDKSRGKASKTVEKVEKTDYLGEFKKIIQSPLVRVVWGTLLGCLSIYLLVSFLSYFSACIQDQSNINSHAIGTAAPVENQGGEGGARLSEFLINECFGLGSFVIILWLGAMCLKMLVGKPRFKSVNLTIKCLVALITVSLIVGLSTIGVHSAVNWGGYHGRYVNEFIIHFVGWIGAVLLCVFMITLFVMICLRDLIKWIMRKKKARDEHRRQLAEEREAEIAREAEIERMQKEERMDDIRAGESADMSAFQEQTQTEVESMAFNPEQSLYDMEDPVLPSDEEQLQQEDEVFDNVEVKAKKTEPEPELEVAEENTKTEAEEDVMVVTVKQIEEADKQHFRSKTEFDNAHKYQFPPTELLRPGTNSVIVDPNEQAANQDLIRKTLLDFKIPISHISATAGPTVTLYEIVPDTGVKIARIKGLADDIAMRLSASGVRIIAPIPGKGTVGIEVPNQNPQTVSMRTVIRSQKFQETKYNLPVALGSTISNEVYMTDLCKMPHLLVAGATGQGKSVGLNAIVASLLYSKSPSELKFVLIDPKQVEFALYNKLKNHYMAVIPEEEGSDEPVITNMDKVEMTLSSLVEEMEQRYALLKKVGSRKLEEYNEKARRGALNPADGHRFLPYIVIIVDEFADLIMTSGKNVEVPIARLAQKARAVGMHVIIATQRPSVNVITGLIKANFPARIAFKVTSGVDSKTILDTPGAQQLIGRGDMLIFNNSEMVRVQCAFIDTPEVESIVDYVSKQPYAPGPYLLPEPQISKGEEGGIAGANFGERDQLFEESARRVVQSGTASTSSLQRVFSIGYNRAGKIMDQLEAAGIVGPSQGGKPRAVLVDQVGLESILNSY